MPDDSSFRTDLQKTAPSLGYAHIRRCDGTGKWRNNLLAILLAWGIPMSLSGLLALGSSI
jgi:hypothetical protein